MHRRTRSAARFVVVLALAAAAGLATPSSGLAGDAFVVGDFRFEAPAHWQQVTPASAMRKAQFSVPDPDGLDGTCIFYHFGPGQGGSADANIVRWRQQFQEPEAQAGAEVEVLDGPVGPVHLFRAAGTYLSGMPGGPTTPVADYALLAAVLESPRGNVFVRLVGSEALAAAEAEAFRGMVTGHKAN